MASFLLLLAMTGLVVEVTSSARFPSVPAFHNKIERRSDGSRSSTFMLPSLQQQQQTKMISVRGGAKDEETNDDDDAVESGEDNDEDEGSEIEEASDDEDETDDVSSDDEDYYDEETDEEEEEEESVLASQLKKKSSDKTKSSESFVEPYFVSPSLQMYTTFGTILLSRKIDMFNPKVVGLVRFLFVVYLAVQQSFIFYIRIQAKRNNDRTPVQVKNPLTSMLSSQLEKAPAAANDMVKNLASSFLQTDTTIMEYDMGQAKNMQGGILFNMALMWFLHFKMQQVQPLLVTTINGLLQLAYNPLFQVYILGRNLKRPFKSPEVFKDPKAQEESADTETTAEDAAVTGDSEGDEAATVDEEESSDDEDEDSTEDDGEEDEDSSDEEDDSE